MPKTRHPPDATDKTHTFLARYGATVLRGGIAAIPTAIFTYQALLDLSPQETWFISYILAHKWDEDLPYPSLRKMGERTGLSVRQLHRIKDSMVEKGYLQLVPRHRAEDGGQDSNACISRVRHSAQIDVALQCDRREWDDQTCWPRICVRRDSRATGWRRRHVHVGR